MVDDQRDHEEETANRAAMAAEANAERAAERAHMAAQPERTEEIYINGRRVWAFLPVKQEHWIDHYLILVEAPGNGMEYATARVNSLADTEWYAGEYHHTWDRALASLYRRAGVIGKWTENRIKA